MVNMPVVYRHKNNIPDGVILRDCYDSAVRELFFVRHPQFKKMNEEAEKHFEYFINNLKIPDCYIYFPWRNLAIRTVEENFYFELRTARNRNIISFQEQNAYRNFKVGIIGLSIGSGALASLVRTGGPKTIKIADHDTLEITNLNRLNANLCDIGENKAHIAGRNIWGVDPFADLYIFDNGVDEENLEDFILGAPKLDCVIDALDNLRLKFLLRDVCRRNKIPVLMGTDIGDDVILDVERYDIDENYLSFHGTMGDMTAEDLKSVPYPEWVKIATKIVDPMILPMNVLKSIDEIGKTIAGVPQLGSTVAITGAITAQAVRQIACGHDLKSGRYIFRPEDILDINSSSPDYKENLQIMRSKLAKRLNS